jgi:hypothetical protein
MESRRFVVRIALFSAFLGLSYQAIASNHIVSPIAPTTTHAKFGPMVPPPIPPAPTVAFRGPMVPPPIPPAPTVA